jgi:hypothetical protein
MNYKRGKSVNKKTRYGDVALFRHVGSLGEGGSDGEELYLAGFEM